MYKKTVTKPIPPGAETRVFKGQNQVRVRVDGKLAWQDSNKPGRFTLQTSCWYARHEGKEIRLSRDRVVAEIKLAEIRKRTARVEAGLELAAVDTAETAAELVNRFTTERLAAGVTEDYARVNRIKLKTNLAELGCTSIRDIRKLSASAIRDWAFKKLAGDQGKPIAPGTLRVWLVNLQNFIGWLKKQDLVAAVPGIPKINPKVIKSRAAFTREMVDRLVAAAPFERGILYRLLFSTLARIGSVYALRVQDLHLDDEGGAWLGLRAETTKTKTGVRVPILRSLVPDLRTLVADRAPSCPVFSDCLSNANVRLDADLVAAGISRHQPDGFLSLHSFRHGGCTALLKAGASPFAVMKLGGWKSMNQLTKTYGHLIAEDARGAMEMVFGS